MAYPWTENLYTGKINETATFITSNPYENQTVTLKTVTDIPQNITGIIKNFHTTYNAHINGNGTLWERNHLNLEVEYEYLLYISLYKITYLDIHMSKNNPNACQ